MNIQTAIEIKKEYLAKHYLEMTTTEWDADRLSIEALKSLQQHRDLDICYACKPLPGETE